MIKPKMNADTKVTIVMWVFISSTQRHLAAVSATGPFPEATCLPVSAIPEQHGSCSIWRSRYDRSSERLTLFRGCSQRGTLGMPL